MSKQKLLLGLLLLILAAALVNALRESPQQRTAPVVSRSSSSAPSAVVPRTPAAVGRLQVELLSREKDDFPGVKRDIFTLVKFSPPPPPALAVAAISTTPVVETVMLAPAEPSWEPAPFIERDLAQFTFLGFLQKGSAKTIFLSSKGDIFIARQGDRFGKDKEFTIAEITSNQLLVRRGGSPAVITVALKEQAPLSTFALSPPPSRSRRQPVYSPPVHEQQSYEPEEVGEEGQAQDEASSPLDQKELNSKEDPDA